MSTIRCLHLSSKFYSYLKWGSVLLRIFLFYILPLHDFSCFKCCNRLGIDSVFYPPQKETAVSCSQIWPFTRLRHSVPNASYSSRPHPAAHAFWTKKIVTKRILLQVVKILHVISCKEGPFMSPQLQNTLKLRMLYSSKSSPLEWNVGIINSPKVLG